MLGAAPVVAQDSVRADSLAKAERPNWFTSARFYELRLLTAHHSPIPTRMPVSAYRDLYIVDIRAGWTIASRGVMSVEYAPSIVPLAVTTGNPEYRYIDVRLCRTNVACLGDGRTEVIPIYHNAYAFGLSPIAFQLRLFRDSPVQILAHLNGGALWFTRPVPDPAATRFNFTAELGGAVQIPLPDRYGLIIGYVWHHTSNAGTGRVNPGLNSRALTFGIVANRDH